MESNFDMSSWWRNKILLENSGSDSYSKAEDNLYKKVTGEEPKASSKNKFRDVKEGKETYTRDEVIDLIRGFSIAEDQPSYKGIDNWIENNIK